MLNFFKKKKEDDALRKQWTFEINPSFNIISNGDSIQYVNSDESRIIYFSVVKISGGDLLPK